MIQDWIKTAPACLIGDIEDATTIEQAVSLARVQLDLIEERQDGTEHYTKANIKSIRRWIESNGRKG